MTPVFVVDACRTPIGKVKGALAEVRPDHLAADAITALIRRNPGLDVTSILIVRSLLKSLAEQGKAILYSSHVLEVVEKICSRVLVLHKGSIVADDSVENLRHLMKLPSLEEIFTQLVQHENTEHIAQQMVEVILN